MMRSAWIWSVCSLLAGPISVTGAGTQDFFDYLVVSQMWPVTSCDIWEAQKPGHTCNLPAQQESSPPAQWTIHGLWPSRSGSSHPGPFYCNRSATFDKQALQPILHDLQIRWPSVHADTDMYYFWKHEWDKHGTCAITLPEVASELLYFSKGLDLNIKFNLSMALANYQIVPGRSYSFKQIADAVEQSAGHKPTIVCVNNPSHSESATLLSEIRICLSRDFSLIDCPTPKNLGCLESSDNLYPDLPHPPKSFSLVYTVFSFFMICAVAIVAYVVCKKKAVVRSSYGVLS